MHSRFLIFLGMTLGSIIGGYLPVFFGVSILSFISVIFSSLGAIIGIIIGYKLSSY